MKQPLAILLGLGVSLVLLVVGALIASAALLPPGVDWVAHMPPPAFLAALLGITFGAGVIGGYVAAHATSAQRFRTAVGVAAALAALVIALHFVPFARQPTVFLWLAPLLAVLGALGGGGIRTLVRDR